MSAFRLLPSRSFEWIVAFVLFALPVILLLPGLGGFPFPNTEARYSDLAVTHFPYTVYFKESLLAGRIPLWSPLILGGAPFAANPLSGLWYPPGWLALMLPLPLAFSLLVSLHLTWGGWGIYRLMASEGLHSWAALIGALAYILLPKFWAHYGAGHVTLIYSLAWTPWLLLARRRRPTTHVFWEPIILALIFAADPRWAVYAGIAWVGYGFTLAGKEKFLGEARYLGLAGMAAALLAAPAALPLAEFTRLSTRSLLEEKDFLSYSLPPERILGLLFPDRGGFHETMLYVGQVVLLLALISLLGWAASRERYFWLWTALVSLAWSLGDALPGSQIIARLPLLYLMRVPSRGLFLTGIALACLASYGANDLLAVERPVKFSRRVRLVLVALTGLSLALTISVAIVTPDLPPAFLWGSCFSVCAAVWIGLRLGGRVSSRAWISGLALVLVVDLAVTSRTLFTHRSSSVVLAEGRESAEYLSLQAGPFRTYSPSYSLPQQTAAVNQLELADGVDPLQLTRFVEFMRTATGVPATGYSVTLPPFEQADPAQDNTLYRPDSRRLGLLNVTYVLAEFDLPVDGLDPVARFGNTIIYQNRNALGPAWIQDDLDSSTVGAARLLNRSPERIEIQAEGPGILTLAENAYPGWRVWVDGVPQPLMTVEGVLRGVRLSTGSHHIVFVFHPLSVYIGLGLWLVGASALIISTHFSRSSRDSAC